MNLSRIFTLIGIVFGAMFVFINAGELPGTWPIIIRVLGAMMVIAAIWPAIIRSVPTSVPAPDQQSIRAYWIAVIAEVIAIPVGANIINRVLDRPELTVLWVVFIVGMHFLPARAFGFRQVTLLGSALIAFAVLGTVATLAIDDLAAPATAVVTGLALLTFSAANGFSVRA